MYVCVCRAVTDRQLRSAIDGGACTRKQLVECFGVGRVCGKCNDEVKAMLEGPGCSHAGLCGAETVTVAPAGWNYEPLYSTATGSTQP